ncbi:MarR family winged helix-turn-helix transcriptional regulator [Microbacterium sp. P01]|uniref:MarR family winged helix-turn-helix transcriptional regulator n=1 Tax=Microbacterium sp. P01 TaxID=3366261 RepID=UPI00366D3E5E
MSEAGAGQALFSFVRHWSRRWDGIGAEERAARGRDVLAVEAVHALMQDHDHPAVNDVARELGLDQSNASRLLSHAADAGYLTLNVSPSDRRRRTAALTAAGHQLLAAAHAWQDEVYRSLTAEWTNVERTAFAQAMSRLVATSTRLDQH